MSGKLQRRGPLTIRGSGERRKLPQPPTHFRAFEKPVLAIYLTDYSITKIA